MGVLEMGEVMLEEEEEGIIEQGEWESGRT